MLAPTLFIHFFGIVKVIVASKRPLGLRLSLALYVSIPHRNIHLEYRLCAGCSQ